MNWPEVPFEQLYKIPSRNGLNRPSRVRGAGHKMINMGELFAHDRIGAIEMERVSMNERELDNMLVDVGDLLFARQSLVLSGAGKCSIVKVVDEPTTFESHLIRVRLRHEAAYPDFYYYYFKSPASRIRSIVTQGVQAGIRATDLSRLSVHLPPLATQKSIAAVFQQYDDLIENNRRRIQLLEQAARHLYKEWFVRLCFPGHEHVKMREGVPEGWEKQPLGNITTLNYGKGLKEDNRIPGPYPVYGSSGVIGMHEKPLVEGPGIIVGRKGNAGSVFWSDGPFFPIDTVYFITPEESTLYLYYALLNTTFISTDVAVPGLNRDYAHSKAILVPRPNLLKLFEESVAPLHLQMAKLRRQSEVLQQARDLLLPRLMNGEITV